MASRRHFEIAISTLIIFTLVLPTPHADAFTSNQSAAIVIGQRKDSPYALGWPAGGLAFDPSGNLWVADLQNSRVLGFMSPFSSNINASIVLGQPDFHHAWGSGWFANEMTYPSSVTFDRTGDLWVADSNNNRITEFTLPSTMGWMRSSSSGKGRLQFQVRYLTGQAPFLPPAETGYLFLMESFSIRLGICGWRILGTVVFWSFSHRLAIT